MKLQCPQCSMKCVTFKQYTQHISHSTHIKAMRERSQQLKQTLANMRIAQRAKQKKVDEEDVTNMSTKSTFCFFCKLNYSQDKSVHQASEAHKVGVIHCRRHFISLFYYLSILNRGVFPQKLKNFLLPYCSICRISFKSPMSYERHICSLEHMRRKSILDEKLGKTKGSSLEYLDNFMVLDSVGSGDG